MAWILLCFDVLPTIETRKGTRAMPHHYSAKLDREEQAAAQSGGAGKRAGDASHRPVARLDTHIVLALFIGFHK
jgi:hypothetical protein